MPRCHKEPSIGTEMPGVTNRATLSILGDPMGLGVPYIGWVQNKFTYILQNKSKTVSV